MTKMIKIPQGNGLFWGLADHLIDGGITILQYADDTILMLQDDVEGARNLKLLLYMFESMSGLKINFEKSEMMLIRRDEGKLQDYADLFNCQKGKWPIKYLGTPVSAGRIFVAEMAFLEDKVRKKMGGWLVEQCLLVADSKKLMLACPV